MLIWQSNQLQESPFATSSNAFMFMFMHQKSQNSHIKYKYQTTTNNQPIHKSTKKYQKREHVQLIKHNTRSDYYKSL